MLRALLLRIVRSGPVSDAIFDGLFLSTGNTARPILAGGILRKDGLAVSTPSRPAAR